MTGIRIEPQRHCDICDKDVGLSWDIHMILQHPETRPKPAVVEKKPKAKRKKK